MVLRYKRYLHHTLLNLIRYSMTITLFLIISGAILICYMLYGQYRTNYTNIMCRSQSNWDQSLVEQRLLRDECLLDQFTVQPSSIELTLPVRKETIARDAVWQTVQLTKFNFFVYSAYLDTRMESVGPVIRIIATTTTYYPETVWCRLWYSNSSKTVSAYVNVIKDHMDLKYTAAFVMCKLPPDGSHGNYPLSVSVVSRLHDPITNEILIQIPDKTKKLKTDIEICIKPFHSHYDTEIRLMEFVELYYLLGVRHFTFYNTLVSQNVQCVLDRYRDDELISILPWELDLVSNVEITTEGSQAALNDCLYRNMYKAKYIAFVDIDEMIIPKQNITLIQLIKELDSLFIETPEVYSYSFRNALFCMEWSDDELSPFNQDQTEINLVVLRKTYRRGVIQPHKTNSKYICNPRQVLEAGNHFVREFLHEGINSTVVAPTEIALLHNYRSCNNTQTFCECNRNYIELIIIDRSVQKYKTELVKGVANTRNRFSESCVFT